MTVLTLMCMPRYCWVKSQMMSFNFFFAIHLGQLVLNHADNLSATLQKFSISASEGQYVAKHILETIEKLRYNEWILSSNSTHASTYNLPAQSYPTNANAHSDMRKDQHQDSSMMCLSHFTGRFTLKPLTMPCPPSDQDLISLNFKCIINWKICYWKALTMRVWKRSWQPWQNSMVTT